MTLDAQIADNGAQRRRWSSGNVVPPKTAGGHWAIRWRIHGKRQYRCGFKSREEAEKALAGVRSPRSRRPMPALSPQHVPCEACGWVPPAIGILNSHHIIPRSEDGSDDRSNLALLCPNCHTCAHRLFYPRRNKASWPTTRDELLELLGKVYGAAT